MLLPPDELKQLFPPQLNSLLKCHTDLLDKLLERLANPKYRSVIGDLFADLCSGSMTMDFLLMYSGYVQAFPAALSVYDRSNKEFRGFIHACMDSPICRGLDLCGFLLTPIQRLPRYLLLLNELSNYTGTTHPGWYFSSLASDRFKACLVLLNESIHHVLHVASQSTAWQCEPRSKHGWRSVKLRKHSKRASKSVVTRASSNTNYDLDSNTSSFQVESCPPSIFPAKSHRSPIRAQVKYVEDNPPMSPPALISQTDSGMYQNDPDELVPQKTILELSGSILEQSPTT